VLQEVTDEYGSVGASRSWGAQVGKTWLLLAYHYAGHRDLALELAFELLEAGRRSDVVRFGLGAWAMVMDSLHTGQVETAEVLLHEWSLRVPKTPMTHSRSLFEGCRNVLDNVRGQPEAALERIDALDAEVTAAGCTLAAWDQAHWYLPGLEAAVRLGRDGTLTAAQRRVAVRRAKRLIAKTPPFFACLGHRALGLLAHQQGGDKEARTCLLRALEISETAGGPRHRWLCLRAAKEAGWLPEARCEELDRLENTWGYR